MRFVGKIWTKTLLFPGFWPEDFSFRWNEPRNMNLHRRRPYDGITCRGAAKRDWLNFARLWCRLGHGLERSPLGMGSTS